MKRRIKTVLFIFAITFVFTGVVHAQTPDPDTVPTIASLLAPLAAAALAIERLLEGFWGLLDSIGKRIKDKYSTSAEFKTWFSAFAGLVIGVYIAQQSELKMFDLVGFKGIVSDWDVILTGLVIGSGSKFTHDVIGIFSEGKKLVGQAQDLVKTKKLKTLSDAGFSEKAIGSLVDLPSGHNLERS